MITIARIIEKFKPEIVGNALRKQGWLISEMQGNGKDIYINVWGDNIEKYKEINDGIFYFSLSVKSSLYNGKYYTNVSLLELFELVDDEKNENNKSYYNNEDPEEALARLKEALEKGEAAIISPAGDGLYTPPSMRLNHKEKVEPDYSNIESTSYCEEFLGSMTEEEIQATVITPERIASLSKHLEQSQEKENQTKIEGFGISEAILGIDSIFNNPDVVNENTDLDILRTDLEDQIAANVPNLSDMDFALKYLDKKIAEAKKLEEAKTIESEKAIKSKSSKEEGIKSADRVTIKRGILKGKIDISRLDRIIDGNASYTQEEYEKLKNEEQSILFKYFPTTKTTARLDEITDRKKEIKLNRVIGDDPTYALEEYKRLKSEENSILSKYFPTTITTAEKARIDEISDRLEEIIINRAISKDPRYALEEYQKLLNENQSILSKYIPKDELPPF